MVNFSKNTDTNIKVGVIDASSTTDIGADGCASFNEAGVLIIRGLINSDELKDLQAETFELVKQATSETLEDTAFKKHALTGERVPYRIEHVTAKSQSAQKLMAHEYVLRSMEKLLGPNLVPTWDSMVFKQAGKGAVIPWHRDQRMGSVTDNPIAINVDFYLDVANEENCLWAIPGSHLWSDEVVEDFVKTRQSQGFSYQGGIKLPMQPGDVLLHNVFVLHGSPECQSELRRIIYYEFRNQEGEKKWGPHTQDYVRQKQDLLRYFSSLRKGETGIFPPEHIRIPHEHYWRDDSAFVPGHL